MSSDDFYYSATDGGYRIGTFEPSSGSCNSPNGLKNTANLSPITPSKYLEKDIIEIGRCSFYESKIVKITISSPVKTIENCAFFNCYELKEVTFPSTASKISWHVFYKCSKLSIITFCRNEAITVDNQSSGVFYQSNTSMIIKVPINSAINAIAIINTKKVLNPSCLLSSKKACTCKIRNRLLSTFTPIIYLIIISH